MFTWRKTMRTSVVTGIVIFLGVIMLMLHCDAPDPDSGACKNRVRLFALPSQIIADGVSTTLIQAFIKDEFGHVLEGSPVQFVTSAGTLECGDSPPVSTPTATPTSVTMFQPQLFVRDPNESVPEPADSWNMDSIQTDGAVCDTGGGGIANVTLTSSTIPDIVAEITVYVPAIDCRNTIDVQFMRAEPYHIILQANPSSIPAADGDSYITATVTDSLYNVVTDVDVDFNTNLGQFDDTEAKRTIITTNHMGQATAILESRGTPGVATVTAAVPPNLASITVIFY
jgi:hypothetical protein